MLTRLLAVLSPVTAPLLGFTGIQAAQQVSSSGPDLQGIALIITSISGLITTVGALIIALRKKPADPDLDRILEALEKQQPQEDES